MPGDQCGDGATLIALQWHLVVGGYEPDFPSFTINTTDLFHNQPLGSRSVKRIKQEVKRRDKKEEKEKEGSLWSNNTCGTKCLCDFSFEPGNFLRAVCVFSKRSCWGARLQELLITSMTSTKMTSNVGRQWASHRDCTPPTSLLIKV